MLVSKKDTLSLDTHSTIHGEVLMKDTVGSSLAERLARIEDGLRSAKIRLESLEATYHVIAKQKRKSGQG